MKRLTTILTLHLALCTLHSPAAVPLRWQVETSRVQPVAFDAVRGETLALEAAFNSYGTPLQLATNATYNLFYQTNGMGSAWWQIPASVSLTNRVSATFAPTNDPGASSLLGFLGSTGDIYRAVFTLRFRNGPGATPNAIAAPVPVLDLASTTVVNPPWPTTNDFTTATNEMQTTLKTYVDEQITGAGTVSPQTVTNISASVTSNVVTTAYVEGLGISAGLTTNDVRTIVTNATDDLRGKLDRNVYTNGYSEWTVLCNEIGWVVKQGPQFHDGYGWEIIWKTEDGPEFDDWTEGNANDLIVHFQRGTATRSIVPVLDSSRTLTDTDELAAATNGLSSVYYPKASGDAWSTYWDGDDVRVTVTNYDSAANIPSLYLEQRTNETALATNLFKTVWREMAHWEKFLGTNWNWRATWGGFASWSESLEDELTNKADRAWGYYDSHTGSYAPDGYTVISSSNVMIAANMSYQKTVTSSAEVWVLTANEPYEPTGISTNGGFQIRDVDGNVQFEIVKGDKVTAAAQANAVTVDQTTSPNTLVVTYNIVANQPPTAEVCLDLSTANWKAETAADCPATVTWSGSSGAYVARIQPTASTTKCFVKASYERGGDTYIRNRCAVSLSQIILNGTTYTLGTATISGSTVLTLTPAN